MATELFIIEIRARGATKVARDIKRINTAAVAARKTMALFRNALVLFAAIRMFGGVIRQLADFDNAMQTIKAITQATGAEFKKLEAEARKLGATTKFTATEAAEGMLALGRAGFDTREILAASANTLDLAIVGAIDLGKASEITAGTLRGFGLAAEQTERVVDVMTFTAQKSLNTILDLGESFKLTAPVAGQLGVTVEQLAAQFVVLGQNNVRASLAGTALKRVMLNLESPGGKLKKILKGLKIPFNEVRVSAVGLSGAMKRLKEAGLGVSQAGDLFGLRGAVAFSIMSDLADDAVEFEKAMNNLRGTTAEAARIIEDSLQGALDRVRSAAEAVNIAFGDLATKGILRSFFEGLADTLRWVATNIENVVDALKVLVFGGLLLKTVALVKLLTKSFIALTLAMLRNPLGALAVALTAATAALVTFQDKIKLSTDDGTTFADVWKVTKDVLGDSLVNVLNTAGFEFKDFQDIATTVATKVADAFVVMVAIINGVMTALTDSGSPIDSFEIFMKGIILDTNEAMSDFINFMNEPLFGTGGGRPLMTLPGAMTTEELNTARTHLDELIRLHEESGGSASEAFWRGYNEITDKIALQSLTRRLMENIPRTPGGITPFKGQAAKINAENKGSDLVIPDLAAIEARIAATLRFKDSLRDLEAAYFPVLAGAKAYHDAQKIINDAVQRGIVLLVNEEELLKRVVRANLGLPPTLKQVEESYKAIRLERVNGNIDMEEEIILIEKRRLAHLNSQKDIGSGIQRFFLKRTMEAEDAATQIETVLTNAFQGAEDALHDFVTTGKADFSSLVDSIISDLARMAIKMAANSAFQSLLGGSLSAPGGITGQTNGAQTIFDSIGSGSFLETLSSTLFGAAHGANFRVGSSSSSIGNLPGVDNRLVAFKARDGEEVSVTKKSDAGGTAQGNVTYINFNVKSDNSDSFLRSRSQIQNQLMFGAQSAMRRR